MSSFCLRADSSTACTCVSPKICSAVRKSPPVRAPVEKPISLIRRLRIFLLEELTGILKEEEVQSLLKRLTDLPDTLESKICTGFSGSKIFKFVPRLLVIKYCQE